MCAPDSHTILFHAVPVPVKDSRIRRPIKHSHIAMQQTVRVLTVPRVRPVATTLMDPEDPKDAHKKRCQFADSCLYRAVPKCLLRYYILFAAQLVAFYSTA
ncbi:unnamed protein product [Phytophthora fragariaefolia]|uniref:Unnamed protein product n=1 Tax=Phytophthora fragariaefolia TaxID=1490495 RepID=A0A9W6WUV5_9STRA|nr:unnamed protein product [Phytophthora fragariaefolia]